MRCARAHPLRPPCAAPQRKCGRHSRHRPLQPGLDQRVLTPRDFKPAIPGFLLLTVWKMSPWVVVALLAAAGAVSGLV